MDDLIVIAVIAESEEDLIKKLNRWQVEVVGNHMKVYG